MQDKYNQFQNLVLNQYVEVEDFSNYAQCMDLIFKWLDFLGIPRDTIRHLFAYQVWTNPFDSTRIYFDLIPNGPTNMPQVGDIPIFGQSVGPSGHISLATNQSTPTNLVSLDQNWGTPKYTRLVTHFNYAGVLGWLHPKTLPLTDAQKEQKIRDILGKLETATQHLVEIRQVLV